MFKLTGINHERLAGIYNYTQRTHTYNYSNSYSFICFFEWAYKKRIAHQKETIDIQDKQIAAIKKFAEIKQEEKVIDIIETNPLKKEISDLKIRNKDNTYLLLMSLMRRVALSQKIISEFYRNNEIAPEELLNSHQDFIYDIYETLQNSKENEENFNIAEGILMSQK